MHFWLSTVRCREKNIKFVIGKVCLVTLHVHVHVVLTTCLCELYLVLGTLKGLPCCGICVYCVSNTCMFPVTSFPHFCVCPSCLRLCLAITTSVYFSLPTPPAVNQCGGGLSAADASHCCCPSCARPLHDHVRGADHFVRSCRHLVGSLLYHPSHCLCLHG